MNSRVRLAGVAVLLSFACASAAFAQQADSTSAARPLVKSGARPGRGSVGAQIGGAWILSEKDYSQGAQPRLSISGQYGYVIGDHWRWQVSPYFAWNAYGVGNRIPFRDENFPADTTKDQILTQVAGGNAQLQYQKLRGAWLWHFGFGPSLLRVVVQNHRKVLKDPVTKDLHQGQYLGAVAEIGAEHFFKELDNTSLEYTVGYQTVFAKRDDQFPSGFNGSLSFLEVSVGAHYYFAFNQAQKPAAEPGARPNTTN